LPVSRTTDETKSSAGTQDDGNDSPNGKVDFLVHPAARTQAELLNNAQISRSSWNF